MSQRIEIENFNTIKHLKIHVSDLMVIIGEQTSGKSTLSKAIYFFKSLRDDVSIYLREAYDRIKFQDDIRIHLGDSYEQAKFKDPIEAFTRQSKRKFTEIYGSVAQFDKMRLHYDYGNSLSVTVRHSHQSPYIDAEFSPVFCDNFRALVRKTREFYEDESRERKFFQELSTTYYDKPMQFGHIGRAVLSPLRIEESKRRELSFFHKLSEGVNDLFGDDRELLFIPAGRIIAALSEQQHNIESHSRKTDYFVKKFIELVNDCKLFFEETVPEIVESVGRDSKQERPRLKIAQELIASVLCGNYRFRNGSEFLEFSSGHRSPINFASSGQQEALWILLLIFTFILRQQKVFLVIEEPEAHLFPVAQKQVVDLIALLANQANNQIIVTTHSPYILAAYNNLLYAHKVGQHDEESISEIVDPLLWLDADRVAAYILEDGGIRSIVDPESKLIHSAEIDRASEIIVDVFDRIFDFDIDDD